MTEAYVSENGKADGRMLREIEQTLDDADAQVVGMVRNKFRVIAPNPGRRLRAGDILVIEAESQSLATALSSLGLEIQKDTVADTGTDSIPRKTAGNEKNDDDKGEGESEETALLEAVVRPGSSLIGRSANNIRLSSRYGLNRKYSHTLAENTK
nr:TrkA C-terminal domain-containing protein [Methylomarinum sp. Ch1-1]MDP4519354.1 TrkA C-terminal domain-containing protein [Methylomarinum sp. Ch1-1]